MFMEYNIRSKIKQVVNFKCEAFENWIQNLNVHNCRMFVNASHKNATRSFHLSLISDIIFFLSSKNLFLTCRERAGTYIDFKYWGVKSGNSSIFREFFKRTQFIDFCKHTFFWVEMMKSDHKRRE